MSPEEDEDDCMHYIEIYSDPANHIITVIAFALLYSVVFVLGLAGNVGLIVATCRHRSLQTVQNIFIVNLAISDVILCVLSIPLTPVTHMFKQWYFGSILCQVVGGTQAIGVFIGTFSLCAIAIDRYFRLVVAPGRPLRKMHAIRITMVLWFISLVCTLPYVIHMDMREYKGICGQFCTEKWPNVHIKRTYSCFVLVIQFLLPFSIMTVCYHAIFSFLRKRASTRLTSIAQQANLLHLLAATAGGDSQQHKEQLTHLIDQKRRVTAQKRRVTLILVSMVVIFGVTALPHNIVSILTEIDANLMYLGENDLTYLVSLLTHFLAMISCVANPLLYAFLNPEFRELILNGIKWAPYMTDYQSKTPQSCIVIDKRSPTTRTMAMI